jgi:2'-5' RNA ligase
MIIQQTHFIGVQIPASVAAVLQNCREWMHVQYGCKSGYGTPIHITLIPPFHLDENFNDGDVCDAVKKAAGIWLKNGKPLICSIDGFGTFSERTLFAYVKPSGEWENLRDTVFHELIKQCPSSARKDTRPFQPHLTIANRDIPEGAAASALVHFSELNMKESFPVDNITVFIRSNGKWLTDDTAVLG